MLQMQFAARRCTTHDSVFAIKLVHSCHIWPTACESSTVRPRLGSPYASLTHLPDIMMGNACAWMGSGFSHPSFRKTSRSCRQGQKSSIPLREISKVWAEKEQMREAQLWLATLPCFPGHMAMNMSQHLKLHASLAWTPRPQPS